MPEIPLHEEKKWLLSPLLRVKKLWHKKRHIQWMCLSQMAERTGLEPATPGVTGRYSNQLNYRSKTVM